MPPIVGAAETKFYRNKLEYTFSTKEYTVEKPARSGSAEEGEFNTQSQALSGSPEGGRNPHTMPA